MSTSFYKDLTPFTGFNSFSNEDFYHPAPSDWYVIITDVQGSTKAIESGRYKEVNTIGVAAITALQNVLQPSEFPFVFGGDGMSALLPPDVIDKAKEELSALRMLSEKQFNLTLRVGMVQLSTLEKQGSQVLVAKYQMENGQHLAMFSGGGLSLAEDLIKGDIEQYGIPVMDKETVNLERLSCRWRPIPATNDIMLSILVQVMDSPSISRQAQYETFSAELNKILGPIQNHNPVNYAKMTQKSGLDILKSSYQINPQKLKLLLHQCYFYLICLLPGTKNGLKFKKHCETFREHSDYWKFDDMLRMVIDCTSEQYTAIERLCQDWQSKGWIVYGIHPSDSALMTCQFDAFADGKHMHFIDGSKGGYAMAAKGLKLQLKTLKVN